MDILLSSSPFLAKSTGRVVVLRPYWEYTKIVYMMNGLRNKFNNNDNIKQKLLYTAGIKLVWKNDYEDDFWGIYNGSGLNVLGVLLMELRDQYIESL